jgi:predicted XRE-type DNA-binding protein
MSQLKYSNIFDAITDNAAKAADLKFRANVMLTLRDLFQAEQMSQVEIGILLDIPQSRVSELMTGKIHKFSSDKLIGFLAKAGYTIKPQYERKGRSSRVRCEVQHAATAIA